MTPAVSRRPSDATVTRAARAGANAGRSGCERLGAGAAVLRGFALSQSRCLLSAVDRIAERAPFRHMTTPAGLRMSVAMTNCGTRGWVSDRTGYRYVADDPETGRAWPGMPDTFIRLAGAAAAQAGFTGFIPDACLINRYVPGAKLSLHQDRDERDFTAPIVSVSLGLPVVFLFGGAKRTDKTVRMILEHGDVVVWGGVDRLRYHGVLPLKDGRHPMSGAARINLTLRKAS